MKTGGDGSTVENCSGCAGAQLVYAEILAVAKERRPIVPTGFELIMVECCQRSMPLLRPWFEQELQAISTASDQNPVIWGDLFAISIIAAASNQCPASPDRPDLEAWWVNLLDHPRFKRYAQRALAQTNPDQTLSTPTSINGWHKPPPNPASA